jgi:hypothetical protein
MTIVVDEQMLYYYGLVLRVTMGQSQKTSVVRCWFLCQNLRQWFFDDPPMRCPAEAPVYSRAAAQTFEHGFMIWSEQPDRFYVLFADNHQVAFFNAPYTFGPGKPVNETPPPGYFAPVSGFGKLWREEMEGASYYRVRERLGWATEAEFAFDTAFQCAVEGYPGMWNCYLRAPGGKVLCLYPESSAKVRRNLWKEW